MCYKSKGLGLGPVFNVTFLFLYGRNPTFHLCGRLLFSDIPPGDGYPLDFRLMWP